MVDSNTEESYFVDISTGECAELVSFIKGTLLFRQETESNIESFGKACGALISALAKATAHIRSSSAHGEADIQALSRNARYYNFKMVDAAPQDNGWRVSNDELQTFLENGCSDNVNVNDNDNDSDSDNSNSRNISRKIGVGEILTFWKEVLVAEERFDDIRSRAVANCDHFPSQIIHGDLNLSNVLFSNNPAATTVPSEGDEVVTGVLDFELCAYDLRISDLVDCVIYLFDSLGYSSKWNPMFSSFFRGVNFSNFRLTAAEADNFFDLLRIKVLFTWRYRVEEACCGRRVDYSMKQLVKLAATHQWLVAYEQQIRDAANMLRL